MDIKDCKIEIKDIENNNFLLRIIHKKNEEEIEVYEGRYKNDTHTKILSNTINKNGDDFTIKLNFKEKTDENQETYENKMEGYNNEKLLILSLNYKKMGIDIIRYSLRKKIITKEEKMEMLFKEILNNSKKENETMRKRIEQLEKELNKKSSNKRIDKIIANTEKRIAKIISDFNAKNKILEEKILKISTDKKEVKISNGST